MRTSRIMMTVLLASVLVGVLVGCIRQPDEDDELQALGSHMSGPLDLTASAGASAPALVFEGDTDTGLYNSAANTLGFAAGGTEIATVDSSGLDLGTNALVVGAITASGTASIGGNTTLGDAITDLVYVRGVMRTYDGTDYIEDIDVSDIVGTNNGWQAAYNVTAWGGETAMTALMAETKIANSATTSGCTAYGADFMARLEGQANTTTVKYATNSTGIGVYAEVQAVYTSTWPIAYAVFGELEAASGSTITDSSVFRADLVGTGTFGTVDVLSVKAGDTYDYGIDLNGVTISSADYRFQNGTELEEVTDTVLTFSEFLAAEEQTAVVVTSGSIITATGTYQPLTSSGAQTTSTACAVYSGTVEGQLLILVNENASDAITIDDGGNTKLSGDAVLGADDTLMLMWDGTDWLEIAQANNT